MNQKHLPVIILILISFFLALVSLGSSLLAEPRKGRDPGIQLLDVGVIGLTSHDLISWDREKQSLRHPKERLDLSTVFDWVDTTNKNLWETGGDPKNSENAVVFSVVQQLLSHYRAEKNFALSLGRSDEAAIREARVSTIQLYLKMVRVSYERLFGIPFPSNAIENGETTAEEHAAMRASHHILPGTMKVSFGPMKRDIELTDFRYAQLNLTSSDLTQPIAGFSGKYAEQFVKFKIPFGPRAGENQNLYEIDKAFVEKFTSFKFDNLIQEISEKGSLAGTTSEPFIQSLYAKGLGSADNDWMKSALQK